MKSAKKMFEELGYTVVNERQTYIEYLNNASWGACERIKFDLKRKRFVRDARTAQYNKAIRYISLEEYEAILVQIHELGWIE